MSAYVGRFAPSPTGPLHAGSLVAALASWLDARAHGGQWQVRIEDVDLPRCPAGMDRLILGQLARCGLHGDGETWWQSRRDAAYAAALGQLLQRDRAYPCACTRRDIESTWAASGQPHERHGERPYPGTCRTGLAGRPPRAWRFRLADGEPPVQWVDRRLGPRAEDVAAQVGDFVLRRADGLWAYQLAVVVDDGAQGVTDIVRGEDLADNTARQILLQRALDLPRPRYLHAPLVRAADGHKLSKQNGAEPLELSDPLRALQQAAMVLGLPPLPQGRLADWLAAATQAWAGLMA
jgi:glutamyl-Q tRNA(Asp) synthetase